MTRTLEISDETYEKIKSQLKAEEMTDISSYEDMIGKSFFFRTVTYHWIGKVKKIVGAFLQLEQSSWVADSGRFMDAIKSGTLNEVEPVGISYVQLSACTDIVPWVHALPTKQK